MKFFRLLHAILREIFDESAYERFRMRAGVRADRRHVCALLGRHGHNSAHRFREGLDEAGFSNAKIVASSRSAIAS